MNKGWLLTCKEKGWRGRKDKWDKKNKGGKGEGTGRCVDGCVGIFFHKNIFFFFFFFFLPSFLPSFP